MNNSNAKKRRGSNFTPTEKRAFLEIVKKYFEVIDNKDIKSETVYKKRLAWGNVTREYNAVAISGQRTMSQLRHLYENIKHRSKNKCFDESEGNRKIQSYIEEINYVTEIKKETADETSSQTYEVSDEDAIQISRETLERTSSDVVSISDPIRILKELRESSNIEHVNDCSFPYIVIIISMMTSASHFSYKLEQSAPALLISTISRTRNLIILLGHWLVHAYGIISLTGFKELWYLSLVPAPALFYILTAQFTDPIKIHSD